MATVEERLIAFQVVRRINALERSLLAVAGDMKLVTDENLEEMKENAYRVAAINEKSMNALKSFLANYPRDQQTLARGYQWIGVTPKQVSDAMTNLETGNKAFKQALEAGVSDKDQMAQLGNQVHSGVESHVTEVADVEAHYRDIHMHCAAWDLVCATALVLQGLNSGTGEPLAGDSVDTRRRAAEQHRETFWRIDRYLDLSVASNNLVNAMEIVGDQLGTLETLDECRVLGQWIDSEVPRIPLVRRHWQYV